MVTIAQIYDWFMTGKKPTQAQFWASWGSFWNKLEQIPQSAISNLTTVLNAKAEKSQFDAHKTDDNAHTGLFATKEDKTQKGVAGGYVPLDEFVKIANEYLTIVNDLVTGGSTSLASAETVKTLKTQINSINTILTSNDVNLDNVQELVDAIKTVQTSLSTILVNDLTTGGTTKALTAEMGKILKGLIDALTTVVGNKVDKVAGERLINAGEITKLAGLGNIVTTIKPILSTALATQNVAGMVTYINALTPVLVVGGSEIVKYNLTDTGRVFELNLRGRSFGVGQATIVAADVLEVTEFLNKDIKLSNYPSTRNDGQLPTNKVLSTDVNGNLKMYTIATAPPPYLDILVPDSTQPSTTTNFTLKGAFFTPTMTVVIGGTTVNYITFKSDNLVLVNVTTGATEGSFPVTLNNGIQAVFPNALLISLGQVFIPQPSDFTLVSGVADISQAGEIQIASNQAQGVVSFFNIPLGENFQLRFKAKASPISTSSYTDSNDTVSIIENGVERYRLRYYAGPGLIYSAQASTGINNGRGLGEDSTSLAAQDEFYFERVGTVMYFKKQGVTIQQFTDVSNTGNIVFKISIQHFNIGSIKYIKR